jgi:ribosomal protein S18 acetylase RimI-like enzyme
MAITEANDGGERRPTRATLQRIVAQRAQRYTDIGPDLTPLGSARFRQEGSRLLIAYAQLPLDTMSEAIRRIVSYSSLRGMRAIWTVVPEVAGEEALPKALLAHSFTLDERLILMAREGELHAQINPSVSISRIETWSAMWAYEHGSRRSFYNEQSPEEGMVTARARERWRQQEMGWYRYYAALLDNQIVGGLYVSMWEDVPTLMGVYTLQTARRHGVATTAIARAIHDLIETGRDTYCLYVKEDNPAQRLYNSLGFHTLSIEETYTLGA